MSYRYSDLERANLNWFENDVTRASLKGIVLTKGTLRALKPFRIDFKYPIAAIAGKNGGGKSSVLAIAACAFHGPHSGWKLPDRKLPYYRFSDFFVQASIDRPLDDLEIYYNILYNNWNTGSTLPNGVGLGYQARRKPKGGKWNDYDARVPRATAFFGIERVVPPSERAIFRSYKSYFSGKAKAGWEDATRMSVAKVLLQPYEDFEVYAHTKYRLPSVTCKGAKYTGLNMGAGEKALFELFGAFWACPEGTLLLVDEIELGLHESAQRLLIRELSEICEKRKLQLICTTHSPVILGALPPEGRFLISPGSKHTNVTPGITPAFAAGRLGEHHSNEATIYVEDTAAETLLRTYLSRDLLSRVRVVPIGSNNAVTSQLASRYLDQRDQPTMAVLDGDQAPALAAHVKRFTGAVGKSTQEIGEWAKARIKFLPGGDSPERWLLGKIRGLDTSVLANHFRVANGDSVRDAVDAALLMGDHDEVFEFAKALSDLPDAIWRDACRLAAIAFPDELKEITSHIEKMLEE